MHLGGKWREGGNIVKQKEKRRKKMYTRNLETDECNREM